MKKTLSMMFCLVAFGAQAFAASKPAGHFKTSATSAIVLGYTPAASSGLTLSVSSGSVYCDGAIQTYGGGTLIMKAEMTNYVYLDPSANCAPEVSTSIFPGATIPIATVVAGASSISQVIDARVMLVAAGISGAGACAPSQFVTAVNSAAGPTCVQPSFSELSGDAVVAQLPVATTASQGIVELAGDLSGTATAPAVAGLQGNPVSAIAPAANQVLAWNGTAWAPSSVATGAGAGVGACAPNQFVTANNTGSAPTCAQPAFADVSGIAAGSQLPGATGSSPGAVELAGDLAGTASAPAVAGLQGNPVSAIAPAANQVLAWNGTAWAPSTPASGTSTTFAGDLSGSSSSQTVVGLQGRAVAATAPNTNQILTWNGSAWAPGALSSGGVSLAAPNTWTAPQTFSQDLYCKSQRPCVAVVAEGADPTGRNPSDAAFAAAEAAFKGKSGGTIVGCGTFRLTTPWVITSPGIRVKSNCGDSGSALQGAQRGGFVIESTTNSAIPTQTSAPSITSAPGGSLTAGNTYYIETTLVNGFGETTPSPATRVTIASGDNAIKIRDVQYQSGGFAYNVYCSTSGSSGTFYLVPSADFESDSGTNAGPPFLVDLGTNVDPVLKTCPTSGTAAPTSNSSTDANTLVQVGTSADEVSGGPEFDNVYFYDPDHVLGAGLVIVGGQRVMCYRCSFEGFTAVGTSPGGEAAYEDGGIAYALLNASTSSNFCSLIEPEFYTFNLAMLLEGSDATVWGGDAEVGQGVGFDYPAGNVRMYGTHFALNGKSSTTAGVIRGNSRSTHYGGIFSIKTEQAQGAQVLKLQYAANMMITDQCQGNSSTTCVTLDSHSGGNTINVTAVPGAVAFSDGSTPYHDPTDANTIIVTGTKNAVYAPSYEISAAGGPVPITAGSGVPSGSCETGGLYLRTNGGSGSTLYVCEAGSWVPK